ncbi:unnamed protein product [Echinostoma caproni]|uniref:Velvet domain-containing protein n=1 Tax=Echinostoma caproni TaxID=27848 RepID=A0A183B3J0_9TREM|nr:unnamed protein product [Echinostoma caproni]
MLGRLWRSEILRSQKTSDNRIGVILNDSLYLSSSDIQKTHFLIFELSIYDPSDETQGLAGCWGAEPMQNLISENKGTCKCATVLHLGPCRYRAVDPIPLVLLDLCSETSEHTIKRRRSCVPSPSRLASLNEEEKISEKAPRESFCLLARNAVQLAMPRDPECAIVFVMEYTICDRGSESQRRASSVTSETKAVFTVRWGVYQPFLDERIAGREESKQTFHVALRGTSAVDDNYIPGSQNLEKRIAKQVCPDGAFCFRQDTKCNMSFVLDGEIRVGGAGGSQATDHPTMAQSDSISLDEPIQAKASDNLNQAIKRPSISVHTIPKESYTPTMKPSISEGATNLLQSYTAQSNEEMARQTLYQQMAQQVWVTQERSRTPSFAQPIGPFLGGQGPAMYEPLQAAPNVPYIQLVRGITGPISLVAQTHRGAGLSRAAYARLYRAGFSQVLTESGNPPFTINPEDVLDPMQSFSLKTEATDTLSVNEIVLQFLAYSSYVTPATESFATNAVYFTFQFYRFPQFVTQK